MKTRIEQILVSHPFTPASRRLRPGAAATGRLSLSAGFRFQRRENNYEGFILPCPRFLLPLQPIYYIIRY